MPRSVMKTDARTSFRQEGVCFLKEPLKNLFAADIHLHMAHILTIADLAASRSRTRPSYAFVHGYAVCGVRSLVYGRVSGSKKTSNRGGWIMTDASGGPAVLPSSPCNAVKRPMSGQFQPMGKSATPGSRRSPLLSPSESGTTTPSGWNPPSRVHRRLLIHRPDFRTTHSTGIETRRDADVQSVPQKAFGADKDPFAADRRKVAMDG